MRISRWMGNILSFKPVMNVADPFLLAFRLEVESLLSKNTLLEGVLDLAHFAD